MLRPVSTQENKHGIGPDRKKMEPAHGLSVPIFLKYFQLFWSGGVDNTRWKRVQPDLMLIFPSTSGKRTLR